MLSEFLSSQTTISNSDLRILPFTILGYALYRLILSNCVLKPLSSFVPEKSRYKFVHRGFDCIHYITSAMLGTLAFLQQPYAHCPFYFVDCGRFIGCTGDNIICSVFEKIYYFYFASYYISDVFWLHTSPNGIRLLIFHHIVTIGMIVCCAIVARPVLGFSIMVLHDWVDIFLYSGKISNYLGAKKISDVLMVIFAVLFFYLRLFGCATIIKVFFTEELEQPHHYRLYIFARILFCFLYVCHLLWAYQILSALKRIIFSGEKIRDTRSDEIKKPKAE